MLKNVFFQHDEESNNEDKESVKKKSKFCQEGENCRNQSCEYTEEKHIQMKHVMCRFQSKCNRAECAFKHVVERAAFLEICTQNSKPK